MSLGRAVCATLARMDPGDGGIIAVDKQGAPVLEFTTGGMFRAHRKHDMLEPIVAIW